MPHDWNSTKSFRRMSIWERGHFSNRPSLNPVTSLDISAETLRIKKKYTRPKSYRWTDIERAFIASDRAYKTYGAGTGGRYLRRTLHILTPGGDYKIDVSSNFPDFKHSRKMLAELKRHLAISTEEPPQ